MLVAVQLRQFHDSFSCERSESFGVKVTFADIIPPIVEHPVVNYVDISCYVFYRRRGPVTKTSGSMCCSPSLGGCQGKLHFLTMSPYFCDAIICAVLSVEYPLKML